MENNGSSDVQIEEMVDLRQYANLLIHWLWLILLFAIISASTAFYFSRRMTPYYQSTTTVLVNAAPATQATDYSSVMMSKQLTSTYSQMMAKDPALTEVINQLDLDFSTEDLKKMITLSVVHDTQLIQVAVESTDAELSANIANSIASVSAKQIEGIQSQRFSTSKKTLEDQMADLEKQITIYTELANITSNSDQKDRMENKVTQYREIYSNLLLSYEEVRLSEAQSVSSLVQIEVAKPKYVPVRPKVYRNSLLAAVVGFILITGIIFLREALNDTIKTPNEIVKKFQLPVLGIINHRTSKIDSPITMSEPRSPTSEAYRMLRTNINYASVDKPLHTIMITSPDPGEGKTTVTANLSVVMAQNGLRVFTIDCDLRHPKIHNYFGISNNSGMSNLFFQPGDVPYIYYQTMKMDNLSVITTGPLPPNPAELLSSQKMQSILKNISQASDVVLIDTPPVLAVTDASVLAPILDGVLLVVRPGRTRIRTLRLAIEQLKQVNAKILGVVINDVDLRGKPYAYQYRYYRNYSAYQEYYSAGKDEKKKMKNFKAAVSQAHE